MDNGLIILSTIVTSLSTAVIAWLSYLVFKSNKRIEWLTGAMETHSEIQMVIEAQKEGIEIIWWDPTIEKIPTERSHGEPRKLNKIYTFLPLKERKN